MENLNINLLNTQENKGLQSLHVEHVSDKKFVWLDVYDITGCHFWMSLLSDKKVHVMNLMLKTYFRF